MWLLVNGIKNELIILFEKILNDRYEVALEIHRMTEELKSSFDRNDTASSDLILLMRSQEMEKYDVQNQQLERLCDELGEESFYNLILYKTNFESLNSEYESLVKLAMRTKHVLSKAKEIDEKISRRLAGDNSYYCN